MSGGYQFLDIILFALVAAFLILRLRSVLGRRNGHQGPTNDPFDSASRREKTDEKVVRLPDRSEKPAETGPTINDEIAAREGTPLEVGLTQIRVADPKFNINEFQSGSRMAFEMILTAFAAGDTATLKNLLSPEVFGNFSQSIREREQAGETMETTLVGIKSSDVVEAYMAGQTAHVTIKFVTQQINVMRDKDGEIVDGDLSTINDVTDFWTFARDTRSSDPNWMLVATGSLD
jgi:predicted lipid-binding transport protein (Tim44 family)